MEAGCEFEVADEGVDALVELGGRVEGGEVVKGIAVGAGEGFGEVGKDTLVDCGRRRRRRRRKRKKGECSRVVGCARKNGEAVAVLGVNSAFACSICCAGPAVKKGADGRIPILKNQGSCKLEH